MNTEPDWIILTIINIWIKVIVFVNLLNFVLLIQDMELQIQQKDTEHHQIITEMQENLQVLLYSCCVIPALFSLMNRLWKKIIKLN